MKKLLLVTAVILVCWSKIDAQCPLTCTANVNIDISSTPVITVTHEMLLEGDFSGCGPFEVTVTTPGGDTLATSPEVTFAAPGQQFIAIVRDITTGNECWSTLTAIDATNECVDTLFIDIQQVKFGDSIRTEFVVNNYTDIVSFQFAVKFDTSHLQFIGLFDSALEDFTPNSFNLSSPGIVRISYFNLGADSQTLPNGTVLFSFSFYNSSGSDSAIDIDQDLTQGLAPLFIEVTNIDQEYICLESSGGDNVQVAGNLQGYVRFDENQDCGTDTTEEGLNNKLIRISRPDRTYYTDTDSLGFYSIYLPEGNYNVEPIVPNTLWGACTNEVSVNLMSSATTTADLYLQAIQYCPLLSVDASAAFLRRCFDNTYHINYCNEGTVTAPDPFIELLLDPYMSFVSTTENNYSVAGQLITFDLDTLHPGECGTLSVIVHLDCDATVLGQTHCVEATGYPHGGCIDLHPQWTGASIDVEGTCIQDSVRFIISNTGVGDMNAPVSFIVIEDDVMYPAQEIQLLSSEEEQISFAADGSTFRLTADQVAYHPAASAPTVAIEGCGANSNGQISTGFVTMFSDGDQDMYNDIECQENIGSYDPNDKMALPRGYRNEHFIKANTQLEYRIRFQNTGTDTAFTVVVKDSISGQLDIETVRPGASSHPYDFSIESERTLVFTFNDIMLVDSTTNAEASNGFLSFTIDQVKDLSSGDVIFNEANIYFDFNEPITTNQTYHEIGTDFVEIISTTSTPGLSEFSIYPNPALQAIKVRFINASNTKTRLALYNSMGQQLAFRPVRSDEMIDIRHLAPGMYFMHVIDQKGRVLSTAKFVKG